MEREKSGRAHGLPHLPARARHGEMVIGLTAVAVFAQTVGFGSGYDDPLEIVLNPLIRSLANLPIIFMTTAWAGTGAVGAGIPLPTPPALRSTAPSGAFLTIPPRQRGGRSERPRSSALLIFFW